MASEHIVSIRGQTDAMLSRFWPYLLPNNLHSQPTGSIKWTFLHLAFPAFIPFLPEAGSQAQQLSFCRVQKKCKHTHPALKMLICWNLTLTLLSFFLPSPPLCVCVYKTRQGTFFTCLSLIFLFCTMAAMQRIPQAFTCSRKTKLMQRFVCVYLTFPLFKSNLILQ